MSTVVQSSIVALLVVAAAIYATWLLMPARARLRIARWMLRRISAGTAEPGPVRRLLQSRLQKTAGRAEAGCANCPANGTPRFKR